jgi:hypothetical protein
MDTNLQTSGAVPSLVSTAWLPRKKGGLCKPLGQLDQMKLFQSNALDF